MLNNDTKNSLNRGKLMLYLFSGFLFLLSFSIILMPMGSALREKSMILIYCSGTSFWIGLIGTICMAIIINFDRKRNDQANELKKEIDQIGLLHFFRNKEAKAMDIVMFISIVAVIFTKFLDGTLQLLFAFLALFVFSFGMHCMLNGINYTYLKCEMRRNDES